MSDTLTVGSVTMNGTTMFVLDCNDDDAPEPDYEAISVPGRNGDLHFWNGRWKNKLITYHCVCTDNARTAVPALLTQLLAQYGYQRITDTLHTDYYKMGEYVGATIPVYSDGGKTARFDLTFDCKPQKWLLSGETEIEITSTTATSPTRVHSPAGYNYPALPLLKITGYGLCRLMSPSYSVTISSDAGVAITSPNPIIHDCAINRTHSVNGRVSYDQYATVSIADAWADNPGFSGFSAYHASTATLKVVPRWWKL